MAYLPPHQRYTRLVAYLEMKVCERDWHGVADAAMDLRELLARFPSAQPEQPPPQGEGAAVTIGPLPMPVCSGCKPCPDGGWMCHPDDCQAKLR